ncbi:Radical SAM family enzyme, similar to coproporphyrinogen III oxidase, oxygen-independent, clustered with nucleoside-triphosphatase RdgB [hydrothermal vent metagenome]|uniref:Radical SAM family enzyme, similar to coproporphyrinogen III oxidase, oxygen-independent, clustered with nucleoside-triphosphatase RdgB n=1 Tax=hydrothermal vent metagenome TaxID=652676 RepID=A0A3B1AWA6_9ZZZZ
MPLFTALPPLSLYIHFPWCIEKCPYCDFNSHAIKTSIPYDEYIDCLLLDLDYELPSVWGRPIQSIFMGGGTPSLFPPEAIAKLIQALRARLNFKPDIEITLEANPGTVEQASFIGFRQAGINRLSIGVQSFNDAMLKKLGRIHNSKQAIKAIEAAHTADFNSFNIDLMFGLQEQTSKQMLSDLQTAIDFQPPHLSHYQLTIEPNTLFAVQPPPLPDDDALWDMTQQAHARLAEHHYQQYEVSAFSKSGKVNQCKHNLNYWQFGDYLGIGAGAHQKITAANTQSITRTAKQKHPQHYMQHVKTQVHITEQHVLKHEDVRFEFMLNVLRLTSGFEIQTFKDNTGMDISSIQAILNKAQQNDWLRQDSSHIYPTPLGQQYLNDVVTLFLPD